MTDNQEWIKWTGGENPVPGKKVYWEVEGSKAEYGPADSELLEWKWNGNCCHITEYRVIEEEQKTTMTKIKSDGGATSYYDFPEGCITLNDLIEYKNMNFARGNIFKATYRLGEKDGAEAIYDLKKIIYFAERMLKLEEEKLRND